VNNNGVANTATGFAALNSNTSGGGNTATGEGALLSNTTGITNTADGEDALESNTTGNGNTAIGVSALSNNISGSTNIALGFEAGTAVTTADNVICIGANLTGEDVSNSCYIANIFNQTSSGGSPVFVNSSGKLGVSTSSRRFKEEIKPMDKASDVLFALKPVAFRYKKEIDPAGTPQLGLVAEDVEQVNPDLVVRDKEGRPYSVRYDQVNAMLLNEFLKEHRKVEEQAAIITELKSTVAQQQKSFQSKLAEQETQIEALASGLRKVSAQIETTNPAQKVAVNNP
jgi:hypothetical protein